MNDVGSAFAKDNKIGSPELIALCTVTDVPDVGGFRIEMEGREAIAVFRSGDSRDEYFVTDDQCTHGSASLCDGDVIGEEIECPFHRGMFDLRTGEPTGSPCTIPLRTYRAEVRDGTIYAEISQAG